MVRRIEDEIDYYYDSHSTEEDLMGETVVHSALVHYLVEVLTWLYQGQNCAIYENLNMYRTSDKHEYPIVPDVAVINGVVSQLLRSWRIGLSGPAPQVVFEIASEETWAKDLQEKPDSYAQLGVQEYYAYDPNEPPFTRSRSRRLFGWQLTPNQGVMRPMTPASNGALWSPQLESWLVPNGVLLRLYDRSGQMRLTRAEAEAQRAEVESGRAEMEARRSRVLEEKLRSLGVDPDQIV